MLEVCSHGCCREIQMRARPWSRSGAMPGSTNLTTIKAHARGVPSAAHAQQVWEAPAMEQTISVPSLQSSQHQRRLPAVSISRACAGTGRNLQKDDWETSQLGFEPPRKQRSAPFKWITQASGLPSAKYVQVQAGTCFGHKNVIPSLQESKDQRRFDGKNMSAINDQMDMCRYRKHLLWNIRTCFQASKKVKVSAVLTLNACQRLPSAEHVALEGRPWAWSGAKDHRSHLDFFFTVTLFRKKRIYLWSWHLELFLPDTIKLKLVITKLPPFCS